MVLRRVGTCGSSSGQVVVKEGTSVTLACQAEGNPAPALTWRRADQLLHTGPALTLSQVTAARLLLVSLIQTVKAKKGKL
jgi:hypothetical protein